MMHDYDEHKDGFDIGCKKVPVYYMLMLPHAIDGNNRYWA